MSGFPLRPDRAAFGPEPINRFSVRDAARELDGPTIGSLMMWQITGCGLMVPRVRALLWADAFTSVVSIVSSVEAWDSLGAYAPLLAHPGVGHYSLTYAATYPDKDGLLVATNLEAAVSFAQTSVDQRTVAKVAPGGLVIDVYYRDSFAGLQDISADDGLLVLGW